MLLSQAVGFLRSFAAFILFTLFFCSTVVLAQDVVVFGAGEAAANQDYKEVGSANSKPQFQGQTTTTVFIEWDGTDWILYDTGNGTYYVNGLDTPLPPWDFWEESKASGPPTLSGPRVSYPLAGTYTVGGASPDFATLSAAVDSLNNHGIADHVGFIVRSGTYDEQVAIDAFPRYGASTDSVVFRPESGTVNWNYTGSGVSNNWFVKIDGADHITFNGFSFSVPAGTPDYARIIWFGNVEDLLIKNCKFYGRPNAPSAQQSLIGNFSFLNGVVAFLDNELSNGYYGIRASGNVVAARNTLIQQEEAGITIPSSTQARIFENTITDYGVSSTSFIGIEVIGSMPEIDRNTVIVGTGDTGIQVDGPGARVRNNMVTMYGTTVDAGIKILNNTTNHVLFNTVLVQSAAAGTALYAVTTTQSIVLSNILLNLGGGAALSASPQTLSNYNDLYTTGSVLVELGAGYATLPAWQAYNGQDANSTSKSVTFASTTFPHDLHLSGGSVGDTDLAGFQFGDVTTDFDGDTRSALAPYMGADEATPLNTGFDLTLSFNLEGPWNGSGMNTDLNAGGYLAANALSHPYGGSPWNYAGSESVPNGAFFSSNPTVVDWVYVRLYSGDVNTSIVADDDIVGLLQNNGSVMSVTGDSYLTLNPSGPGDYYVAVYHRNHIPAITAVPITMEFPGSTSGSVNFNVVSKFGTDPMRDFGGGKWALWACDATADGDVTAPDFNLWNAATSAGATGYLAPDCNLDGSTTAPDFNLWNANTSAGVSSQIPD